MYEPLKDPREKKMFFKEEAGFCPVRNPSVLFIFFTKTVSLVKKRSTSFQ